jgi:hypothetical protein
MGRSLLRGCCSLLYHEDIQILHGQRHIKIGADSLRRDRIALNRRHGLPGRAREEHGDRKRRLPGVPVIPVKQHYTGSPSAIEAQRFDKRKVPVGLPRHRYRHVVFRAFGAHHFPAQN